MQPFDAKKNMGKTETIGNFSEHHNKYWIILHHFKNNTVRNNDKMWHSKYIIK